MSTFKVPITYITEINPHPNADNLVLAKVLGYEVIIPKNVYEVDDLVIYVPVGSVLSPWLEELIFPADAKVKLHKSRIRAIKLRGIVSQGMLIDPMVSDIFDKLPSSFKAYRNSDITEKAMDKDVAEYLGITKYVEPVSALPNFMKVNPNANPYKVREFREYTDVEHGKYYDRQVMVTGEEVIITQKMHGTSARYGYFKTSPVGLVDKLLNLIGLRPEWTFCWGSRRCQIQAKPGKTHGGYSNEKQGCDFGDVYTKIAKQDNLRFKIPHGYAVYGEIVGWGIQKGYLYNCGQNQHKFYVYDVMKDGKWLSYDEAVKFCEDYSLVHVPLVFRGPYTMDKVNELLVQNVISKEINEGVVVKPVQDRTSPFCGRVLLKYINPEYLLKDQTEFQ